MGTRAAVHACAPIAAIINPAAGGGRARRRWSTVQARLAGAGVTVQPFETAGPGDASVLARRLADAGYRMLVAVGGDGTIHEIVNGLATGSASATGVRLAVVPAGTGMDFARNLRIPRRPDLVADRILAANERFVDLGISESGERRVFINFAETGLGAAVVAREAQMTTPWPGRLSFLIAAVGASLREDNASATVVVDGEPVYDGPLVSVVVANGSYFGGGMKIAPHASLDDGKLDVLVLGNFARAELVSQIWKLYPGSHLRHPKVRWTTASSVSVLPRSSMQLDLDGELYGEGPYSFSVSRRALRVIG